MIKEGNSPYRTCGYCGHMLIKELIKELSGNEFNVINEGDDENKVVTKVFCCDLLSVAMSRTPEGAAWVTVMANINTLAVASLTDAACVILAEGAVLDESALNKAKMEGITVFATELPVFDAALLINNRIN